MSHPPHFLLVYTDGVQCDWCGRIVIARKKNAKYAQCGACAAHHLTAVQAPVLQCARCSKILRIRESTLRRRPYVRCAGCGAHDRLRPEYEKHLSPLLSTSTSTGNK